MAENVKELPDDTVKVRFRLAEHLAKQYQIPVHDTGINHAQHILSLLESAGLIRSESGDVPFPKGETVAMVLSAYERQCRHDRIDGIGTQPWPFVERIQKMFVTEQSEDRCAFSGELPPPGGLVCGGDKSQPEHNPHDPRFDHFYAPLAEQAKGRTEITDAMVGRALTALYNPLLVPEMNRKAMRIALEAALNG